VFENARLTLITHKIWIFYRDRTFIPDILTSKLQFSW